MFWEEGRRTIGFRGLNLEVRIRRFEFRGFRGSNLDVQKLNFKSKGSNLDVREKVQDERLSKEAINSGSQNRLPDLSTDL